MREDSNLIAVQHHVHNFPVITTRLEFPPVFGFLKTWLVRDFGSKNTQCPPRNLLTWHFQNIKKHEVYWPILLLRTTIYFRNLAEEEFHLLIEIRKKISRKFSTSFFLIKNVMERSLATRGCSYGVLACALRRSRTPGRLFLFPPVFAPSQSVPPPPPPSPPASNPFAVPHVFVLMFSSLRNVAFPT